MVKLRFVAALLASLAWLAAFADPTTTEIDFKVVLPSGAPATSGTVTATLSSAGEAPDGGSTSIVVSRVTATIGSDGSVILAVVPNDIITPGDTFYILHYDVRTPTLASWNEKRRVVSYPNPCAISDAPLVESPPGTSAPIAQLLSGGNTLPKRTRLNLTGSGVSCEDNSGRGRIDCTFSGGGGGGGGTPGGSPEDVQVNIGGAFSNVPGFTADSGTGQVSANSIAIPNSFTTAGSALYFVGPLGPVQFLSNVSGTNGYTGSGLTGAAEALNIFLGVNAGPTSMPEGNAVHEGRENIGIGAHALNNLTTGYQNLCFGRQCMEAATTARYNVAGGAGALQSCTTCESNTAVGPGVGNEVTNGFYNILVGDTAGISLNTGDKNTVIGTFADVSGTDAQNQIALGYGINVDVDKKAIIGNTNAEAGGAGLGTTEVELRGAVSVREPTSGFKATVDSTNLSADRAQKFPNAAGTLAVTSSATGVPDALDIPADATLGGCLTLKEGADDGSNTASVCIPDSGGLSATKRHDLRSDGNFQATSIGAGAVSDTEYGYLDGATSSVQTQLDARAPRNSKYVTVCASGCNYSTVQSALNAANGTSTAPFVIVVMPGTYTECLTVGSAQSYVTVVGAGRYASIVNCATSGSHTLALDASTADVNAFEIIGMSLTITLSIGDLSDVVTVLPTISGDYRFDLIVRDSYIGGVSSSDDFLVRGTALTSPTKDPSRFILTNNIIEGPDDLVGVGDHLNVYSYGNTMRSLSGYAYLSRCFHDLGANGTFSDTTFISSGDSCYAESGLTSATPAIHVSAGAVHFSYGFGKATVSAMTAWVVNTSASVAGAEPFVVGATTGAANLEISGTTVKMETRGASQQAYGVTVFGNGRVVLRGVRFDSSGSGTETDLYTDSTTTAMSYLYLDETTYSTTSFNGSAVVAALNPKVLRNFLRAKDSVALPATGASFDANSELRQFDPATAWNASWRNERVSDLYESQSLYTPAFKIYWRAASATSGAVIWKVGICATAVDEAWPCTVSSFTSATGTVTASPAGDLMTTTGNLPTGILSAGKALVVTVQRDASNGSDTMTGNAEVVGVEISYGVR